MGELKLMTTDEPSKVLGTIRLVKGKATFDGAGQRIFRSIQKFKRGGKSDVDVFAFLAKGWSNGPLKLVATKAEPTQGG